MAAGLIAQWRQRLVAGLPSLDVLRPPSQHRIGFYRGAHGFRNAHRGRIDLAPIKHSVRKRALAYCEQKQRREFLPAFGRDALDSGCGAAKGSPFGREKAYRTGYGLPLPTHFLEQTAPVKRPSALCSLSDGFLVSAGVHLNKDRQKDRQHIRIVRVRDCLSRTKSLCNSSYYWDLAIEQMMIAHHS